MITDEINQNFDNMIVNHIFWVCWVIVTLLMVAAWKLRKPFLFKVVHHILAVRVLIRLYNLEQAKNYKDLGRLVQQC